MKKILVIFIGLFFYVYSFSQPWIKYLPQKEKYTLFDYKKAFDTYVNAEKINFEKKDNKKFEEEWEHFYRWYEFQKFRADKKTGQFPSITAAKAFEKSFINKNKNLGNWINLGPFSSNGGYAGVGRINTVEFHPTDQSTIWVGTPAGGLWVTYNLGSDWTCLTDSNEVLGVSAIAIPEDFETSNTIYIGTGDRDGHDNVSIGVLKSTDGGQTWHQTGLYFNPAEQVYLNVLMLHPDSLNVLYAATTNGLYRSSDFANTWQKISNYSFIDMEFCPSSADTIYASTPYGDIYKSTDGGYNWELKFQSGQRRIELAVSQANNSIVYAVVSNSQGGLYGIFKSEDFGETYQLIFDDKNLLTWDANGSDSGGQGWYDLSLAVDPNDANILFLGGVNTWKSTDGGNSWVIVNHWYGENGIQAVHADKHCLKFQPNTGYIFEMNDGGGYYSTDEGDYWQYFTNGIANSQMYDLSTAQDTDFEILSGLQDNGTKLNKNSLWFDVLGGDGMKCIIDYEDYKIQYGSLYFGAIYRTTDEWTQNYYYISDNIPGGANGNWVTPYLLDPLNHTTIYVGYDKLWKSEDMGNHFESIGDFTYNLMNIAICPMNSDYIYVSNYNAIYMTKNGGTSWQNISQGLPISEAYITDIKVKNNDPNTVWVTMSGYNEYGVFVSHDAGQTWTNISENLPQIPINCIVQNILESKYDQIYVGTDFGVFVKNGDSAWQRYSNKLPNVVVTDLEIYYDYETPENSKLRAATYGRGMWESPLLLSGNYAPFVSTIQADSIEPYSAVLYGEITNTFGFQVDTVGFLIGDAPTLLISDTNVQIVIVDTNLTNPQIFSKKVNNLQQGKVYYFRAFAINENGIGYGSTVKFTTKCLPIENFIWTDNCEYEEIPPCYSQEFVSNNINWTLEFGNPNGSPSEPNSGNYNFYFKAASYDNAKTKLILPTFNLENYGSAKLYFSIFNAPLFNITDQLNIYYRNSNSTNEWTLITSIDSVIENWTQISIDLPNISDGYQIAFEAVSNGAYGIGLDDFILTTQATVDKQKSKISVYPNPTNDFIYIKTNQTAKAILLDINGKKLKEKNFQNTLKLDLSKYSEGTYILKIETSEEVYSQKIIKK